LCHTYNPTWAYLAKALLGAHGVVVSVVHEEAMHLYAPGSMMPCTLLVEEEDWADAVEILRADPVEVDSAPLPPPLPGAGIDTEAEGEVEPREHYFPDAGAFLTARVLGGGALGVAAVFLGGLRSEEEVRWLKAMGHELAAQDLSYAINLLLGHIITTPLIIAMVPLWVWFRHQHRAVYRLDELRREAAEMEEEFRTMQGENRGPDL